MLDGAYLDILGNSGSDENINYIYNFLGSSLSISYQYLYYWIQGFSKLLKNSN